MYGNPTSKSAEEIEHHICHEANNKVIQFISNDLLFKSYD